MRWVDSRAAALLGMTALLIGAARGDALLVKGAWASASDAVTPLPEGGVIADHVYRNPYFGLTYVLNSDWSKQYDGPPPSDSGYYVLAQLEPSERSKRSSEGHALIAAQDMFFSRAPVDSAADLINYAKDHLDKQYKIERAPAKTRIAGHDFIRFDYASAVAQLHWHVLATQVRCHTLEFVFTGRDTHFMESVIRAMNSMTLGDTEQPVCIKSFASPQNMLTREEPEFRDSKFNPIPVRIIVGTDGRVRHVHFLSSFPEQAQSIMSALSQWQFKPYLVNGRPVEVETGIMFGRYAVSDAATPTTSRPPS
jgi:hypothetical protein